jgi:protein-S-isoprenylcysteine O-methyltransferase Ste14
MSEDERFAEFKRFTARAAQEAEEKERAIHEAGRNENAKFGAKVLQLVLIVAAILLAISVLAGSLFHDSEVRTAAGVVGCLLSFLAAWACCLWTRCEA